ncbi:MAG: VanW family protein [Candidatus Peribacteraceae bacterium]|nr:VanW family protein [Candidatus Peribacteraceae bacterium]
MRRPLLTALPLLCLWFLLQTEPASAAAAPLTLRHRHFLFTVRPLPSWNAPADRWTLNGQPFMPPAALLVDGDVVPPLPPGVRIEREQAWNRAVIRTVIAGATESLRREPGSVVIRRTASGAIAFDGVGLPGRAVDLERATDLVIAALEGSITDVVLPTVETQPLIRVEDPTLAAQGIREVVTVGESVFDNSPANRRHNIAVGLAKFNGHLIPRDAVFSFGETLGPVDGTTGYRKELVIKGARTEPDYGGGLCQVSTTAYRGVWEYGFPIIQRINHSYTVSHYFPQGTDATVYPPNVDMKFRNDSPGDLLIQTFAENDLAYFIFYGTKDERRSSIVGPFLWDQTPPPPDRTEYTTDLPPGERKKMGERVPGVKAVWYRFMRTGTGETTESVFSHYEARPLYYLVGVTSLPAASGSGTAIPTMFMEDGAAPDPSAQP